MIKREPHTTNGKFVGMWYHFPDGRQMYLAHYRGLKTKGLVRNAWCIDSSMLRLAERRSCNLIGVIHKVGTHRYMYLTDIKDLWGPESSVAFIKSMQQRTLPRAKFKVNPSFDRALIAKHVKIR